MAARTKNPDTLTAAEKKALAALNAKAGNVTPITSRKAPAKKVAPKVVEKVAIASEIRVTSADYRDGTGIDVRTFRQIKGEWIPGKGIRFAASDAAAVIAGIEALVSE